MRLEIDLPLDIADQIGEACLRRGMPLDDLVVDAFIHAATAP